MKTRQLKWEKKEIQGEEEEDCIVGQVALKVFVTMYVNHNCDFWKLHNATIKLISNEI